MKLDFESLSAEPLFYMLMHSGAFVLVLGCLFFTIGLLFGRATWGRYKQQARLLDGEVVALKGEVADLKRKLADHLVKGGQSVAIATETIHMPPKEEATRSQSLPAGDKPEMALPTPETPAPVLVPDAAPPPAVRAPTIKSKKAEGHTVVPVKKHVEKSTSDAAASRVEALPPSEAPIPSSSHHSSPLAEIIATHPPAKTKSKKKDGAAASSHPEKSSDENHSSGVQAVLDAKLGMIYPTKPEKVDDLTALKGIAKGLEQRLHDLGIYTYAQISLWTEDQIAEFSARLAFKDRIQRERWVSQAQALLGKKSAEAAS